MGRASLIVIGLASISIIFMTQAGIRTKRMRILYPPENNRVAIF